jgi:hypothetical protein
MFESFGSCAASGIHYILHAQIVFFLIRAASVSEDALEVDLDEAACQLEDGLSLLQIGAKQLSSNSYAGSATQFAAKSLSQSSKSLRSSQGNAPDDARPETVWDCCGNVSSDATRNLYFFCEGPLVRPTPETRSYISDGVAPMARLMCGTSLDTLTYPMKYMLLKLPDALNYCEEDTMSFSLMVTLPVRMTDSEFFASEVWYNTPMVAECSFQKLSMLQTNVFRDSGITNPGAAISKEDSLLQSSPSGLFPGAGYQMLQEKHVRTLTFFCEGPLVVSTPETLTHESFGPAPLGRLMCGTSLDSLSHPMTFLFVHLPGGFDCELSTMAVKAMVTLPAHTADDEFFVSKAWHKMAMIPRCNFYDFTQGTVSFSTHGVFNPGTGF